MTSMRQMGEPSVEEILESIKKVIARDNRSEAAQQRARREDNGVTTLAAARPVPAEPRLRAHEVLELTETESPAADDAAQDDPARYGAPDDDETRDGTLLPESAAASMRDSLTALAMLAEPGASPQIVRSGETSLEGLARELMRPMLADWLERNLPAMVEKMVAAEIARIGGKKV